MSETINVKGLRLSHTKDDLSRKFLFIEQIFGIKKIKPEIELCVVQTDFNKSDLKQLQKLTLSNKNTEFWICSTSLSRKNILTANKLGIKTVVSSPVEKEAVEEFFRNKYSFYVNNFSEAEYDYSPITNLKVMIVDDNVMNIELLEEILSDFNLKISSFLKPKEACQAMLHEKFDLFLLDVMMPEMSGFELAKRIKDTPHNKNTPVIFISALADSYNKIRGYDLGSFAYIEKPFDIKIIKSQIFNILKAQKLQALDITNKNDYLATIVHDLKTPISAGITALNLLLNKNLGELEDDQHEIVEDLLNSTKYMRDMVENILCKNKIEKNKIELTKHTYSIKKLIEHCMELTKYILIPKDQQILLTCDTEDMLIQVDFLEMQRAIHNLIANASEHSAPGSKILISIFMPNKNKLGIAIQDFGKGIDLQHQKDVFDQYMSFAKKHKRVGSGLGLYITKNIIEAHNGEIILESKVGVGTKITIFLPTKSKKA